MKESEPGASEPAKEVGTVIQVDNEKDFILASPVHTRQALGFSMFS